MLSASSAAAWIGSSRCIGLKAICSARLSSAADADDGDAGNDGKVEFQPLRHDEDRGELAERRQPAQPEDGIETDIAVRKAEIGGGDVGHCGSLAVRGRDHKFVD